MLIRKSPVLKGSPTETNAQGKVCLLFSQVAELQKLSALTSTTLLDWWYCTVSLGEPVGAPGGRRRWVLCWLQDRRTKGVAAPALLPSKSIFSLLVLLIKCIHVKGVGLLHPMLKFHLGWQGNLVLLSHTIAWPSHTWNSSHSSSGQWHEGCGDFPPVAGVCNRSIKIARPKFKWKRTQGHIRAKTTGPVLFVNKGTVNSINIKGVVYIKIQRPVLQ